MTTLIQELEPYARVVQGFGVGLAAVCGAAWSILQVSLLAQRRKANAEALKLEREARGRCGLVVRGAEGS